MATVKVTLKDDKVETFENATFDKRVDDARDPFNGVIWILSDLGRPLDWYPASVVNSIESVEEGE